MIVVKNKTAILKMKVAGSRMSLVFDQISSRICPGLTTLELDSFIDSCLSEYGLTARCKNYKGYKYASCISLNDVVVHGVPSDNCVIREGDLVKVDVVGSYKGYCADMARCYLIGSSSLEKNDSRVARSILIAQKALDEGIQHARAGNRVSDISSAIERVAIEGGLGIVQAFAGHGIGKQMHEEPEILNYKTSDHGAMLQPGMTLAIEPMLTLGDYRIAIDADGWTARTLDGSLAVHIEDTVLVTSGEPRILTRIAGGDRDHEA